MIYVIGLGGGNGCISENALNIIQSCQKTVLKTALCSSAKAFIDKKIEHITLDNIYQKSRNFDTLNNNLAKEIVSLSKQYKNIAYIVDGGGFDDISIKLLFQKTKNIEIIPSTLKADILKEYPSSSYAVFSAYDLINADYHEFDREYPLAIYEIDSKMIASEIKLKLFKYFDEEHSVIMYCAGKKSNLKLFEIDRQQGYDYGTQVLIPPANLLSKKRYSFTDLLNIMKILRSDGGCPWDREQTHESIKMNAVEEAYELIEAINNNDIKAMEEEAGDLLLQPIFQSRIAEDYSNFDIYDVISELCSKLVFRHSHIFGSDKAEKSSDALVTWEKNKTEEKNQDTFTKSLKGVAKTFPSVVRAEKVQKRAAKCGFDFENYEEIYGKIYEELNELKEAVKNKDSRNINEEGGDLLFAVVNLLRRLEIDGETALNATTDKFIKRFEYMENKIAEQGKSLKDVNLAEMEIYYTESKKCK